MIGTPTVVGLLFMDQLDELGSDRDALQGWDSVAG